ncbi:hypothetical protein RhiirA4_342154 [Rhizophagus irregularis]|uniref:Glycoside hydrolase family 13 N-terminal domain-containing protein n=1 Tax=Rhizophagus irregularis TaxID=588596 RepID=A0A2I1GE36_9GLOM|nr:hypothetical protein RhiirA4_342154 [Rhizophagus irregularis]
MIKHPMKKDSFGVWEVHIPAKNGTPTIPHNIKIKISMTTSEGERIDHLPAWIKRVTQDLNVSLGCHLLEPTSKISMEK